MIINRSDLAKSLIFEMLKTKASFDHSCQLREPNATHLLTYPVTDPVTDPAIHLFASSKEI